MQAMMVHVYFYIHNGEVKIVLFVIKLSSLFAVNVAVK